MYTFQSRAAADLLMLEATAKHILQLLDKTPDVRSAIDNLNFGTFVFA